MGGTGNHAQHWGLMASVSVPSFACSVLGPSVSENPEKDTRQAAY